MELLLIILVLVLLFGGGGYYGFRRWRWSQMRSIAGESKLVKGSVEETVGKAVGRAKLQSDGKAKKVAGVVRMLSALKSPLPKSRID
jgi:hypothetical protein